MNKHKSFYQLTTKNTQPTFYVFFDNMDDNDRLVVYVMIYHLNSKEYAKTFDKITTAFGKNSIEKNEPLEFMKYVVFMHNNALQMVVDMDTLRKVEPDKGLTLSNALKRHKITQNNPIELDFANSTVSSGPSLHHGEFTQSNGYVRFKTRKHGRISFKFSRYSNPNLRNGVSISVQKDVTKDNCYGALIYATDPNFLRVKKISTHLDIPTQTQINQMKNTTYWTEKEQFCSYMGKKSKDKDLILLPTGKYNKLSMDEYTKLK